MNYDELQHHGVKGMKWGVRRDRKSSGATKTAQKKEEKPESRIQKLINKCKKKVTKENAVRAVAKGAEVTSKLLLTSAADDIFYGGAGKKVIKETVKQTGRAAVTAYVMANGGYDIHWYDK